MATWSATYWNMTKVCGKAQYYQSVSRFSHRWVAHINITGDMVAVNLSNHRPTLLQFQVEREGTNSRKRQVPDIRWWMMRQGKS